MVNDLRVALYSPGMVGLGHVRRNLLVAQGLAAAPRWRLVTLLLAEAREAGAFAMPPGVDCLTLPALRKDSRGDPHPRHLGLSPSELVRLRARVLRAALADFRPDVLIVDHLPRGAAGELTPALESLRARKATRCILGLRDILDEPSIVRREWRRWDNDAAIRDYYDAVWVYGDPAVYDLVREVPFPPAVAAKTRYAGYLDSRRRLACAPAGHDDLLAALGLAPAPLVLCMLGGGSDGAQLAEAFLEAELPPDAVGIVVTGPFMPDAIRRSLYARAAGRPRLRVLDFVAEPAFLLARATRVITMGGYNGTCDVLAFGKPALIVPRTDPRREQLLRAERFRTLGLVEVLPPDRLTPQSLTEWLARDVPPPRPGASVDLGGLDRLPDLLEEVLGRDERRVAGFGD